MKEAERGLQIVERGVAGHDYGDFLSRGLLQGCQDERAGLDGGAGDFDPRACGPGHDPFERAAFPEPRANGGDQPVIAVGHSRRGSLL